MKKTISAAIAAAIAISASAQNVTDALRYSQNDYYGTARSIAMGNAFTALGGDLGSVAINPAGSAVNSYSQFSLTPSINILAGLADYSGEGNVDTSISGSNRNSKSKFTMPGVGVVMNYKTNRASGLKSISLGLVGSATGYYNDRMEVEGFNDQTSYMGYLSAISSYDGLSVAELNKARYCDMDPFYWPAMVGYRSGMVNEVGDGNYISPVEGIYGDRYMLNGELSQRYSRYASGNKYDLVMNMGANFNDWIYLGANIGIIDLSYTFDSYINETAVNPSDFPVTIDGKTDYFQSMRFHQAYSATGTGIYMKVGAIVVPAPGLRLGAAIQTPVSNYITERLWFSGDTQFGHASGSETIYDDEDYIYTYKLRSPYRLSAGIAYTLPGLGLISADYEMCDYSTMRFREADWNAGDSFKDSNKSIRDGAGISNMIRIGAEFTPTSSIALRAGYNLTTTPERYLDANGLKVAPDASKHAVSFGLGYKSAGSFFCDAAARCSILPYEYIYPYDSYDDYVSPEICVTSNLWNLVFTFGWRF